MGLQSIIEKHLGYVKDIDKNISLYVNMENVISGCPYNGECNYCLRYSSFFERAQENPILLYKLQSIEKTTLDYHNSIKNTNKKKNFKPLLIDMPWLEKHYNGDMSKLFNNLTDLKDNIIPNKTNRINIGNKDRRINTIHSDTIITNNIKMNGDIYFKNNYKLCVKNNKIILRTLRTDKLPKMIDDLVNIQNLVWEDGVPDKSISDVLNTVPQLTNREWEGIYLDLIFCDVNLDTDEEVDQFELIEEDFCDIDIDVLLNHKSFIFTDNEKLDTNWKIIQMSGKLELDIPVVELSDTHKTSKIFGVMDANKKILYTGQGYVDVSNIKGNILCGDYITSSDIIGVGCKQESPEKANYTVAKCLSDEDFNDIPMNTSIDNKHLDLSMVEILEKTDLLRIIVENNIEYTDKDELAVLIEKIRDRFKYKVKKIPCMYCC